MNASICPVCGRQGQSVPLTAVEQERCNCQYENPAGKC
ncbi:hypothetical protein Ga0451573_003026 [Peptococcaceae bacterium DYL19]|nr:hypothetical protein [Phosphitispora fastidiosa]